MASGTSGKSQAKLLVLRKARNVGVPGPFTPELLLPGCHFSTPVQRTKRLHVSFIPSATDMLNGN